MAIRKSVPRSPINKTFLQKLQSAAATLAHMSGTNSLYESDTLKAAEILASFELAAAQNRLANALEGIDLSHGELAVCANEKSNRERDGNSCS